MCGLSADADSEDRNPQPEQPDAPLMEAVVPDRVHVVTPVVERARRTAWPLVWRRRVPAPRRGPLTVVPPVVPVVRPPGTLVEVALMAAVAVVPVPIPVVAVVLLPAVREAGPVDVVPRFGGRHAGAQPYGPGAERSDDHRVGQCLGEIHPQLLDG